MPDLFRSLIFVPGNNPRFLAKAQHIEADIICFDLEDSVPYEQKGMARKMISNALQDDKYDSQVFVRVNSPDSGLIPDDMAVLLGRPDGIVIPKVDNIQDIDGVCGMLDDAKSSALLLPSIESAAGVYNTYQIASCKRVCGVVFGIFDLLNDMGIEYTKDPRTAMYARSKIPVDAAAAGVSAIDGIWQDITDTDGFEADCILSKSLGYAGRSIIHPSQICTTHGVFAPTKPEIHWAKLVCKTYEAAVSEGRGAISLQGKMIDEVHYKRALAVLKLV